MPIDDSFDSLYTSKNVYLFDLLFCHQFFLEGYKTGLAQNFTPVLKQLYKEFEGFFASVRYTRMDQFTRAELNSFIYLFRRAQLRIYSAYTQKLIDLLQNFVKEDTSLNIAIQKRVMDIDHAQANLNRIAVGKVNGVGPHETLTGYNTLTDEDAMWSAISNAPIPAAGVNVLPAIKNLFNTAQARIQQLITIGYANGDSVRDTLESIVGTLPITDVLGRAKIGNKIDAKQEKISDSTASKTNKLAQLGFLAKLAAQHTSLSNTLVQHSSQIVTNSVASVYFMQYMWVSIMDSHTTVICWNRNGNVYVYNNGPLPPAHWGCRSHTVPIMPGENKIEPPNTFYDQLSAMPYELQTLLVGKTLADKLKNGDAKVSDFPLNSFINSLSLKEFSDKINSTLQ